MLLPTRKTSHLHYGRVSIPGATYFVTLCTKDRVPALGAPLPAAALLDTLRAMHAASDIELLIATVMPDHVHLLFTLGERLSLGQIAAKFKTLSRRAASTHPEHAWKWQADSYEHRLRAHEIIESFGFYVYMNPYRANLCALSTRWPWTLCPQPQRFLFLAHLAEDTSLPPEWIEKSRQLRM